MSCDQCHEREAVIHLTQIVNEQVTTLHLCERCAAEKGVESPGGVAKTPLGSFLAAMGKNLPEAAPVAHAGENCPRCGASLQDFRESGRLGCSECYSAFEVPLRDLLRRLHGSTHHVGERYAERDGAPVDGRQKTAELREQLRLAVETENFELAAELRDRLRVLEVIDLSLLTDGGVGWLDASGPSSHLVLSTRIRLARNLAGRVFQGRNSETEREDILTTVERAARESVLLRHATKFRLDRLDRTDRQLLHERHLVSKELAGLDPDGRVRSGASVLVQDRIGVMLNEEDHLRIQGLHSGFALDAAYAEVDRLDFELGQRLAFAFHPEFGYLTSCPTNVGTGLRASVLIHLPGLVLTKEISKVLQGLAQVGLTFRGLYGEGSEVVGNFFQLSNQTTLGSAEHELLDHLGKMVRQVMDYEEQARQVLLRDAPAIIEDKVWRAYGLLRYARSLSFEEAMNLLSGVRLGVGVSLIPDVGMYTLNKLLVYTQPAHLAVAEGVAPTEADLPIRRARFVRKVLESEVGRRG